MTITVTRHMNVFVDISAAGNRHCSIRSHVDPVCGGMPPTTPCMQSLMAIVPTGLHVGVVQGVCLLHDGSCSKWTSWSLMKSLTNSWQFIVQ